MDRRYDIKGGKVTVESTSGNKNKQTRHDTPSPVFQNENLYLFFDVIVKAKTSKWKPEENAACLV